MSAARVAPRSPQASRRTGRHPRLRTRGWPGRRASSSSATRSAGRSTTRPRTSSASRAQAGYQVGPAALGAARAAPGRLPHEPLHRARAALARVVPQARPRVLPRPPRDAGLPRVRRGVTTRCVAAPRRVRPRPGDARGDGGARRRARASIRERVFRIPIGIELERFPLGRPDAARPRGSRSASRPRRSSSARSRRTASAGATGSSRSRSRARTSSSRRSSRCASEFAELVVLLTGPARGYVRRELERRGVPYVHVLAERATSSRTPTTRSTPTLVASRQEGGPKSVLESMATGVPLVSDPRRAGDGARRGRLTTGSSSTSRTRARSRRHSCGSPTTPALREALRSRGRDDAAAQLARTRSTPRWAALLEGFVERGTWTRAGALRPRAGCAGRGCLLAGRREPGLRVFYGWDRDSGPGRAGRRRHREVPEARGALPEPARPTSRSSTSGRRALPRDLRPLLWLARRRGAPVVVNQDGVALPGVGGDARPRSQRAAPARAARRRPRRCTRASSASARRTCSSASRAATWEILPNAVDVDRFTPGAAPPAGGPVLLLGGDQTQAYRLELALRDARRVLARTRRAAPRHRRLVSDPEPPSAGSGSRAASSFAGRYAQAMPALFRRAHLLLHTKVNDPCPTRGVEAMACGLPVVYAASGGTVELVADEAGIGVPHPDGFDRDEPPAAEALAAAVVSACSPTASARGAARRRAVERFALAGVARPSRRDVRQAERDRRRQLNKPRAWLKENHRLVPRSISPARRAAACPTPEPACGELQRAGSGAILASTAYGG